MATSVVIAQTKLRNKRWLMVILTLLFAKASKRLTSFPHGSVTRQALPRILRILPRIFAKSLRRLPVARRGRWSLTGSLPVWASSVVARCCSQAGCAWRPQWATESMWDTHREPGIRLDRMYVCAESPRGSDEPAAVAGDLRRSFCFADQALQS